MANIFENFSFLGLIIIQLIFFISRRVLREKKSFIKILGFTILLASITIYKLYTEEFRRPNFLLFWLNPLYSLFLYRLMLIPFWSRKKRDPEIPTRELLYSGNVNEFADKFFGFIFFLLSIVLPVILIFSL